MTPSVDNRDAAELRSSLFTPFALDVAFTNACYFCTSLHSCKIDYLSNVLAPYEGGNEIGKVLKNIMSVSIFSLSSRYEVTHLALVGGDPEVLSSGLQVAV